MPINLCRCGIRFAIGLMRCPRCKKVAPQYAALVKKEEIMPRITVAGGPSNPGAAPGEVGYVERAEHKAAESPAEVKTELRGEHGPELGGLPKGMYMVGDGGFEGAPGLTVLREATETESLPGRLELRPYASMTLVELREAAREQGKPTGGSKADLVARLVGGGVGQVVPEQQAMAEEVSA